MKDLPKSLLLSLLAGALLTEAKALDPWLTVDEFQYDAGLSASAGDIGTDPAGNLYSVGSAASLDGPRVAVVRKSSDSGATWTLSDEYSEPGWPHTHYRGFGAAPDGTLFAAGELWDGNSTTGTKLWLVRESVDGGATWDTVDAFSQGATAKPSCGDIKVNPYTGDVFAVGVGNTGSSAGFLWAVRKRAANTADFSTVDMVGAPPSNEARAVGFHTAGGIFVVGRLGNSSRYLWSVRRSMNGGATWTTVDSFQDGKDTYSEAMGVAVDRSSGAIYVSGRAQQLAKGNKLVWNWVVRRSLNGGATWTVVDRFGSSATELSATGIATDSSGKVFVTGYTSGLKRMLVRKGTPGSNGTIAWVTSDDFTMVAGQETRGNAVTSDGDGNIYTAGEGDESPNVGRLLVRRLATP